MFFKKLFTLIILQCLPFGFFTSNVFSEEIIVREIDKELIGDKEKQNIQSEENKTNNEYSAQQNNEQSVNTQNVKNDSNIKPNLKKTTNVRNNLNQYNDEFYDNFTVVDNNSKKIKKKVKFEIKMVDTKDTKHGSIFQNLKNAYNAYKNGDYELAILYYKKANEYNKESVESKFGLAVSYQLLRQYDQAIEIYLDLLANNFSRKKIVHNLLLCLKHKSYKEALDILLSINENILGYSDILSQIGLIYMKLDDNIKAISAYNRAYELSPMNPIVCYNLGVLYDKQNNLDYARHFLELAVKNDIADILPSEEIRQLEKRLVELNKQIFDEIDSKNKNNKKKKKK